MNVKALRQRLGLSQQVFATRLGIGIATVSRWETGKVKPKRKALIRRLEQLEKETASTAKR